MHSPSMALFGPNGHPVSSRCCCLGEGSPARQGPIELTHGARPTHINFRWDMRPNRCHPWFELVHPSLGSAGEMLQPSPSLPSTGAAKGSRDQRGPGVDHPSPSGCRCDTSTRHAWGLERRAEHFMQGAAQGRSPTAGPGSAPQDSTQRWQI